MRKLIYTGLILVALALLTSPATAAESPEALEDLGVLELVLDWLGISMEKGSQTVDNPNAARPSGPETSTPEDGPDDPSNEIGPVNDPGG